VRKIIIALLFSLSLGTAAQADAPSVARRWNEAWLHSVRTDYARPTVVARNLFHLAVALYDSWAVYESEAKPYYISLRRKSENKDTEREITMSYAAYRLMLHRCQKHPKRELVVATATALMRELGLDPAYEHASEENPAALGNLIAQMLIGRYLYDGSREDEDYATPLNDFAPLNPALIVKLRGPGKLLDVNFWQPLALDMNVDQNGNPIPGKVAPPLTLHWGRLPPFALTDRDRDARGVYLDPGLPPQFGAEDDDFRSAMEQVIEFSSWLDPRDEVTLDISPASIGNNSLGRNDGKGYRQNPVNRAPYSPQVVKRGDYARVLAEFWADGPTSETPPGHWNVVANHVTEMPGFQRRWMGQGSELSRLEWDVKMYLTLNGALYDASIAAWGLKGYYQGSRPISAIRYLAELGQASDPKLPRYHKDGLRLKPGLIELITPELTAPGERFAHLVGHEGELALRAWKGAARNPKEEFRGVGWVLASEWVPYQRPTFVTPPFPGYVSGHSTFSRSAAEVMTAITGSKFFPGGMAEFRAEKDKYLVFEAGPSEALSLQWATYYDAADQCSMSRIFGGIHGFIDDFPGRRIGSKIGRKAVARSLDLFGRP
jgi:hypothetical protein